MSRAFSAESRGFMNLGALPQTRADIAPLALICGVARKRYNSSAKGAVSFQPGATPQGIRK